MKVLIAAQTIAATVVIEISANQSLTVSASKLVAAEVVTFQAVEDGTAGSDLYQEGVIRQLTATHNAITIPGPIKIQISKGVTAGSVGVYGIGL